MQEQIAEQYVQRDGQEELKHHLVNERSTRNVEETRIWWLVQFSSVQSLSHVQLFVTSWTAAHQTSLSIFKAWSLLKLKSIELVMPSNQYVFCYPFLLPSMFSSISVFSDELVLPIRWPKYWNFNFSISLCNEYSELFFFRND